MARAQQTNAKRSHERIEGSSHPRVPALRRAIRRSGELERQIALRRFGDSASSSGHALRNSPVVPEPDSGPVCSWPASLAPGVRATGTDAAWAGQGRLCVPLRAGARVLECLRCARAPPRLCPRAVRKAPTAQPDGGYVNTAGRRRLFAVTVRFHTRPKQRDRARRTVERAQSAVRCGSRPRGSRTAVTYCPGPEKNPLAKRGPTVKQRPGAAGSREGIDARDWHLAPPCSVYDAGHRTA